MTDKVRVPAMRLLRRTAAILAVETAAAGGSCGL